MSSSTLQLSEGKAADLSHPTFADPHSQLAIAYERQGRPADAAAERAKASELTKTN